MRIFRIIALFLTFLPGVALAQIRAGGDTTQDGANRHAFSLPATNMPDSRIGDFFLGSRIFNKKWTTEASTNGLFGGLGPFYNEESCAGCHFRDGRGQPPGPGARHLGALVLKTSLPAKRLDRAPVPHPRFGIQIQDRAVPGVSPEAIVSIENRTKTGFYDDGTRYTLSTPRYRIDAGPVAGTEKLLVSPRIAPAVFGMGLLAAVPESALISMADPEDADGDGISGRRNLVHDRVANAMRTGRFGWKANHPSIRQQIAAALSEDLGVTSALFPKATCPARQTECLAKNGASEPEVPNAVLDALVFYVESLGVPQRRNTDDPAVRRGEILFTETGCASCHRPVMESGPHPNPMVAHQRFAPFTDLLLHDMGEALADDRPDWGANGREWRTPPLWGLGLIPAVNKHHRLLHDGRAKGPEEAILWHGGEAESARNRFRALPSTDRAALLAFLNSL